MADKEWMLNPQAIRQAKACMCIVKEELGIKLTLSNPDFIVLLHEYVEMLESQELGTAYGKLIAMAGPGSVLAEMPSRMEPPQQQTYPAAAGSDVAGGVNPDDIVTVNGRSFPRWNDGKEFRGLYRGQPTYR